ncbi:DUF982 domain-containing protein [Phyllobacterium sp. SB3]|uniref:DUF982 domain-containing protein n=1 Tax=Phyllobacterium sp. SB3 TaxID=3156073 RepID=UPI0032AECA9D
MNSLSFHPVIVESNHFGRNETIASIRDAAAFLLSGWPKKKAPLYMEARVLCYEAQSGIASVDAARLTFIKAAIEADIYVKEGR